MLHVSLGFLWLSVNMKLMATVFEPSERFVHAILKLATMLPFIIKIC